MDVINRNMGLKKIKYILVFFCACLCFQSCKQEENVTNINIHYEDNRGVSLHFKGTNNAKYQIVTKENATVSILGELHAEEDAITFTPVIPFTNNTDYQILLDGTIVGAFHIKKDQPDTTPRITAIYPKLDTVPENLLKMYITFSEPMQEVHSALDFIEVTDLTTQEKTNIFLPLETELWNTDHTELTLWLDPGRIKKDLIPNKELGIPIKEGHSYAVRIKSDWESAQGISLGKMVEKKIVVGSRDAQMPSESDWKLTIPTINSKEALGIAFGEPLDAMLFEKNIHIEDTNNQMVEGSFLTMGAPNSTLFIPKERWKKGNYKLVINSSMEDLAGNNMNRLFDTDLQQRKTTKDTKTKAIDFTIQ